MRVSDPPAGSARRIIAGAAFGLVVIGWIGATVFDGLRGTPESSITGLGAVVAGAVGALLVVRRPDNRIGAVLLAIALTSLIDGAGSAYARYGVDPAHHLPGAVFAAWASDCVAIPLVGLIAGVLPQLFPTGHTLGRWWRLPFGAAVAYIVFAGIGNAFYPQTLETVPSLTNPYAWRAARELFGASIAASAPLGAIALVGSVASLAVRWRRSGPDEKQQLRWMFAVVMWLPLPLLLHDAVPGLSRVLFSIGFAGVAAAIGVAVTRYRLYDLDLAISRALGYAVVSAMVAGMYLGIVGIAAAGVDGKVGLGWQVGASVLAAATFQPLRTRVQRVVDQVFYGARSRPYDAVSSLARSLERLPEPDQVLPTIVGTVASAMRVPYAAIELPEGDGWRIAAKQGTSSARTQHYPMTYQGEVVGRLSVGPRSGAGTFNAQDDRLLLDLARQAGVAAHAARVTADLQRSRRDLVVALEDERRRLRRDLHDGVGPTLAGITLGLRGAVNRLEDEPDDARRRLNIIETQIEEVIADLRRVVYGLRPPALDEFGLVRALEIQVASLTADEPLLTATFSSPIELPELPAAVEVAAYRIALEAVANVIRHANATQCRVAFWADDALHLDVADNGVGLGADAGVGVGITSMRERVAEVGGTLVISPNGPGVIVQASIPIRGRHG